MVWERNERRKEWKELVGPLFPSSLPHLYLFPGLPEGRRQFLPLILHCLSLPQSDQIQHSLFLPSVSAREYVEEGHEEAVPCHAPVYFSTPAHACTRIHIVVVGAAPDDVDTFVQ